MYMIHIWSIIYTSYIFVYAYHSGIWSATDELGTQEYRECVMGGGDSQDALSCRSFSAKEPPIIGLFCGKRPVMIRHPMGLCHPVHHTATHCDALQYTALH